MAKDTATEQAPAPPATERVARYRSTLDQLSEAATAIEVGRSEALRVRDDQLTNIRHCCSELEAKLGSADEKMVAANRNLIPVLEQFGFDAPASALRAEPTLDPFQDMPLQRRVGDAVEQVLDATDQAVNSVSSAGADLHGKLEIFTALTRNADHAAVLDQVKKRRSRDRVIMGFALLLGAVFSKIAAMTVTSSFGLFIVGAPIAAFVVAGIVDAILATTENRVLYRLVGGVQGFVSDNALEETCAALHSAALLPLAGYSLAWLGVMVMTGGGFYAVFGLLFIPAGLVFASSRADRVRASFANTETIDMSSFKQGGSS